MPRAEGRDEGDPIAERSSLHEVAVGGDQRAQIVAEGDVDRRAVVERADAHVEDLARDLARLVGQRTGEIVRDLARRQHARAVGREPDQIGARRL